MPSVKPFYLIVVDRDKNLFNVVGPMTNDNPWNTKVVEAQEEGRSVNCCNGGQDKQYAIDSYAKTHDLEYTENLLIQHPGF